MHQVKLYVVDGIHPPSNKFATGVENEATDLNNLMTALKTILSSLAFISIIPFSNIPYTFFFGLICCPPKLRFLVLCSFIKLLAILTRVITSVNTGIHHAVQSSSQMGWEQRNFLVLSPIYSALEEFENRDFTLIKTQQSPVILGLCGGKLRLVSQMIIRTASLSKRSGFRAFSTPNVFQFLRFGEHFCKTLFS